MTFVPGYALPVADLPPLAKVVPLRSDELLLRETAMGVELPGAADINALKSPGAIFHYLGLLGGQPLYTVRVDSLAAIDPPLRLQGLRSLFGVLQESEFMAAGRAMQLLEWDETHRFCGRCGAPMVNKPDERARECTACALVSYPRISPAIIVAIRNGNAILLARANRPAWNVYSVIAGFVEIGESLEACVHREVREEVGIAVKNVRYFDSQSWPFSNSLMIGFTAEYAGGTLAPDKHEIAEAGWFTADTLPNIPGPLSISRRLIDDFLSCV